MATGGSFKLLGPGVTGTGSTAGDSQRPPGLQLLHRLLPLPRPCDSLQGGHSPLGFLPAGCFPGEWGQQGGLSHRV